MNFTTWIVPLLLGCALPLAIFIGRNNIRVRRHEAIQNLGEILNIEGTGKITIPAYELVKKKYSLHETSPEHPRDTTYSTASFIGSLTLFILLSTLCFLVMFNPDHLNSLSAFTPIDATVKPTLHGIFCFTFLGGYLWVTNYLIKRVANFDLSPTSFLRATLHILCGLAVSTAIFKSGVELIQIDMKENLFPALSLLIGMYPALFFDALIAKFPWIRLKRVNNHTKKLQEEIPLDAIIGIDAYMKYRLSEFEIEDVQNLATINPIQLFVETPYGLYEVIDWVAQAQLILAVGSANTLKLRNLNIRTIFDLEKAARSPYFRCVLTEILLPPCTNATDNAQCPLLTIDAPPEKDTTQTIDQHCMEVPLNRNVPIEALVALIRDDLHVRRLRQLWCLIGRTLDVPPPDS